MDNLKHGTSPSSFSPSSDDSAYIAEIMVTVTWKDPNEQERPILEGEQMSSQPVNWRPHPSAHCWERGWS